MSDETIEISEYRYFYHTKELHSYEDELPVLLPIGSKHFFIIDGEQKMFKCVKYMLTKSNDDKDIIAVICEEIENTIDLKSFWRELKINAVINE